jgi:hypothetical protein
VKLAVEANKNARDVDDVSVARLLSENDIDAQDDYLNVKDSRQETQRILDAHESSDEFQQAEREFKGMQQRFADAELSPVDSGKQRISFEAAQARVESRREAQQSYQAYHDALGALESYKNKLDADGVVITDEHRQELSFRQRAVQEAEHNFVDQQKLAARILYDPGANDFSAEKRQEILRKQKELRDVEAQLANDPENNDYLSRKRQALLDAIEPQGQEARVVNARRKMAELQTQAASAGQDLARLPEYLQAKNDAERFARYNQDDAQKIIDYEDSEIPNNVARYQELAAKKTAGKLADDEQQELDSLAKELAKTQKEQAEYDKLMAKYHGSLADQIKAGVKNYLTLKDGSGWDKAKDALSKAGAVALPFALGGVSNYGAQPSQEAQGLTQLAEEEAKQKLEALGGANLLDKN